MSAETDPNAQAISTWEEPVVGTPLDREDALIVDVAGYEGPLDLLLALARTQKVDIAKISVLALADQYLVVHRRGAEAAARACRRLSRDGRVARVPQVAPAACRAKVGEATDVSAEELARRLSFRLMRLEAMRDAAAELMNRMRLGRDVFQRGMPEGTKTIRETAYTATIYDLLHAYADQRRRTIKVGHVVKARSVWSIKDARARLERFMGDVASAADWLEFDRYLKQLLVPTEDGKTVLASSFGATLELAREGRVELRQDGPFEPIYMRSRQPDAEWQRIT